MGGLNFLTQVLKCFQVFVRVSYLFISEKCSKFYLREEYFTPYRTGLAKSNKTDKNDSLPYGDNF